MHMLKCNPETSPYDPKCYPMFNLRATPLNLYTLNPKPLGPTTLNPKGKPKPSGFTQASFFAQVSFPREVL